MYIIQAVVYVEKIVSENNAIVLYNIITNPSYKQNNKINELITYVVHKAKQLKEKHY